MKFPAVLFHCPDAFSSYSVPENPGIIPGFCSLFLRNKTDVHSLRTSVSEQEQTCRGDTDFRQTAGILIRYRSDICPAFDQHPVTFPEAIGFVCPPVLGGITDDNDTPRDEVFLDEEETEVDVSSDELEVPSIELKENIRKREVEKRIEIGQILHATSDLVWEGEYDATTEKTISRSLPCAMLIEEMGLTQTIYTKILCLIL